MKIFTSTIIIFFMFKICIGQNLITNGDFEQYTGCPDNIGQLDSLVSWFNPFTPPYHDLDSLSGSSDYFNSCAPNNIVNVPSNGLSYQPARSGNGYAGIILAVSNFPDYREYIETSLSAP